LLGNGTIYTDASTEHTTPHDQVHHSILVNGAINTSPQQQWHHAIIGDLLLEAVFSVRSVLMSYNKGQWTVERRYFLES
jgi:hypothetical protein